MFMDSIIPLNRTTFLFEKAEEDFDNISFAKALNFLRTDLIELYGIEQTAKLMFNYGYQLGTSDAQRMRDMYVDIQDLLKQGPPLHCKKGHMKGSAFEGYLEYYDDKSVRAIVANGKWLDSYEAKVHVDYFGQSDVPVCHTLRGFAAGYMSTIFQFEVEVIEKTCVAKGDAHCTWEIHTVNTLPDKVNDTLEPHISFDLIELSAIQSKMLQQITDGATIEDILKEAEKIFGKTFIIEDIFYTLAHYTSRFEEKRSLVAQDIKQYDEEERKQLGTYFFEKRQQLTFTKKVISLKNHTRLTSTIIHKNKVIAYLSMIDTPQKTFTSDDYLILSKMGNVISVALMALYLTETVSTEQEAIFLNDLLCAQEVNEQQLLVKARQFHLDTQQPYTVAVLVWNSYMIKIQKEIESFIRNHLKKQRVLIRMNEHELVILLFHSQYEQKANERIFEELHAALMKQFMNHSVRIGLSETGQSLLEAASHYKEATIALLSHSTASIASFKDSSILSIFINDLNLDHIKQLAKNRFSKIFELKEHKRNELLETLYVYLNNHLKVEATIKLLNISKSGLLYRLDNLKEYLNTDFKNPDENFQLLLLLKAIDIYSTTTASKDDIFSLNLRTNFMR